MQKTRKLYLGIWFQRTSLHLKEFYDFLNNKEVISSLELAKVHELHSKLNFEGVGYGRQKGFDFVHAKKGELNFSMTEDGIILIDKDFADAKKDAEILSKFYSNELEPAISYLYSRGAALPKDLALLKETYPLYLVGHNFSESEIKNNFEAMDDPWPSTFKNKAIEILSGKNLVIVNIQSHITNAEVDEEIVRNIVLFREFERQLSRYLNLHRTLWDQITLIRESKGLTLERFPKIRSQLLDYMKTLSFGKARLAQMEDILMAREQILGESTKKVLSELDLMSRFAMFKADQEYLAHLWEMTIEYAEGTLTLFDSILNENTQREINVLQIITFITVLTSFFGMNISFPWNEDWPRTHVESFIVVAIIIVVALLTRYFLKQLIYRRKIRVR